VDAVALLRVQLLVLFHQAPACIEVGTVQAARVVEVRGVHEEALDVEEAYELHILTEVD